MSQISVSMWMWVFCALVGGELCFGRFCLNDIATVTLSQRLVGKCVAVSVFSSRGLDL